MGSFFCTCTIFVHNKGANADVVFFFIPPCTPFLHRKCSRVMSGGDPDGGVGEEGE